MSNLKTYAERLASVLSATDTKKQEVQKTYEEFGFTNVAENGFNKSNVMRDLNQIKGLGVYESETPSTLGVINDYETVKAIPLKGHAKMGVKYADPDNPLEVYTETSSNTLITDRPDGNLDINRWSTRNIFKFKKNAYCYDRCVYRISIRDLANGIVIDGGEDAPHANTLLNYPYPEEIIMISQKNERNFIHFINVQYTDSHYCHYNGRNYNLMIVKDRIRYGVLDESGTGFKKYTSVYANDVETELAFIHDGCLFLPVPDEAYGEEMIDSLWDCRVIWRQDAPNRNFEVNLSLDVSYSGNGWSLSATDNDYCNAPCFASCYGDGKFLLIAAPLNYVKYSSDGINWEISETTITGIDDIRENYNIDIESVCYGNGKFVAASIGDALIFYSTDGINWIAKQIGTSGRSICYGNGKFVLVDDSGTYGYSTDGIEWTRGIIGQAMPNMISVCYGNGKFVAASAGGIHFMYSDDGIVWHYADSYLGSGYPWKAVCYGNGRFVAISNSGYIAYSTDGDDWTISIIDTDYHNEWYSICYGDSKFVVVDAADPYEDIRILYSIDGIIWHDDVLSDYNTVFASGESRCKLCYGDGKYIIIKEDDISYKCMYTDTAFISHKLCNDFDISNDRVHLISRSGELIFKNRGDLTGPSISSSTKNSIFSSFTMANNGDVLIAPYFDNKYMTHTVSRIEKDTDPEWVAVEPFEIGEHYVAMCYGAGIYLLLSFDAVLYYSWDGETWTRIYADYVDGSSECVDICYGDGKFVIACNNGFVCSTDGFNWTYITSTAHASWYCVCYGGGKFVAMGMITSAYSTDGINWTEVSISTSHDMIAYGNGMFLAVNKYGYAIHSTDGIKWTIDNVDPVCQQGGSTLSDLCFGNGKFVATIETAPGINPDLKVITSTDACTWSSYYIGPTYDPAHHYDMWYRVCYNDTDSSFMFLSEYGEYCYTYDFRTWHLWLMPVVDDQYHWEFICCGNGKFVAASDGSTYDFIDIAYYDTKAYTIIATDHPWLSTGTPNQIFQVTDNRQLGFWYCDSSKRGRCFHINDTTDECRTSQLYFALFDNTFKTINPSYPDAGLSIYPCKDFISSFNIQCRILKVFPDSINKKTGSSSFFVFTTTGVYKFIFTVSDSGIMNTSFETIIEFNSENLNDCNNPRYVSRISKNEFLIFDEASCHYLDTENNTLTFIDSCGYLLTGRTCAGIVYEPLSVVSYNDNSLTINGGICPIDIELSGSIIGRYGYFEDVNGFQRLCKLVETYSFDRELDPTGLSKLTEITVDQIDLNWNSVCYGNGKFVAIAAIGYVATSIDGINWTVNGLSNTPRAWYSICYGNGKFVAVAFGHSVAAYSTDGINWTETVLSERKSWMSVCYGNGKFVTVPERNSSYPTNQFLYSYDGIEWYECNHNIAHDSSTGVSWVVCYGDNKFVAVGSYCYETDTTLIAYSTDGINWTEYCLFKDYYMIYNNICYGNGKYIAVGLGKFNEPNQWNAMYSIDGINWTRINILDIDTELKGICYGNGKFMVVGNTNKYAYSYDGITWYSDNISETSRDWRGVCYANDRFVAVSFKSNVFAYSVDL